MEELTRALYKKEMKALGRAQANLPQGSQLQLNSLTPLLPCLILLSQLLLVHKHMLHSMHPATQRSQGHLLVLAWLT